MDSKLKLSGMVNDQPVACATVLKAIADETRLAVLRLLLDGARNVGEINEEVSVEPTLLSHHLRVLREAGLVVADRQGKCVVYHIAESVARRKRGRGIDLGCCQISFD